MGILDIFRSRNQELAEMFDVELYEDLTEKIQMKQLAIQTCVNLIAKSISQSEFKIMQKENSIKDSAYYRLNVRPNKNMSSSFFWQTVVHKLIHDNECLIIQTDTEDLLIADSFSKNEFALFEDTFSEVVVGGFEFKRTFKRSDVIYIPFNNDALMDAVDGLYRDYGELFARIMDFQKRKGQIRGIVNVENITDKGDKSTERIQNYINKVFKSFRDNSVSIIPQQKGFDYKEIGANQPVASVDEINKVTDGFLNQVAKALGIPIALLIGEMADVEKQTKNLMIFCINPLLKKITDELTGVFFTEEEYLQEGLKIVAGGLSYNNIFDVAASVDKLLSSGTFTINQIREKLGEEPSVNPMCDKHFITKNYQTLEENEASKGGDNE